MKRLVLTLVLLAGCASPAGLLGETVGERFRRVMAEKEAFCRQNPPARGDTQCDRLKLNPRDWTHTTFVPVAGQPEPVPQEWVATPEGRFAHSIVLPNPLPKDSGYRPGMTGEEYFRHLCEKEAGEFIYKTVENVEGVFQIRPRERATDYVLQHLYVMEDPYGYTRSEATEPEYLFVGEYRFSFFESPIKDLSDTTARSRQYKDPSYFTRANTDDTVQRFHGYNNRKLNSMIKEFSKQRLARYGYTWRGIYRENDRELGIAGGELVIVDLRTNEVLGLRRGFVRTSYVRNVATTVNWEFAAVCPKYGYREGRDKDFDFSYWFIRKVLKPINLTKPEPYLDTVGG